MTDELPPLPRLRPAKLKNPYNGESLYDKDEVREYGRQCDAAAVARERERCAKVLDDKRQNIEAEAVLADDREDRTSLLSKAWILEVCAAVIRGGD